MNDEYARSPVWATVLDGSYSPVANCPLGLLAGLLHVLSTEDDEVGTEGSPWHLWVP